MIFLVTLAFFSMCAGVLLLFKVSPSELLAAVAAPFQKRPNMRQRVSKAKKPKPLKGIRLIVQESQAVLRLTNQSERFSKICALSLCLAILGVLIAAGLSNFLLIPVFGAGFAILPFAYILFTATKFKQNLNAELETALSTINISYLRSENFLESVRENIVYFHSPVKEAFQRFLTRTDMIDPDVSSALESMKQDISNAVFHEWVDQVILCQNDRNLNSTLVPIVSKLSNIRIVMGQMNALFYAPMKEFISMVIMSYGSILLLYFVQRDWYTALMENPAGKLVLAILGVVTFASLLGVIRLTRPIEYKE